MSAGPKILLFDSGVGGLSLVPALDAALPAASLIVASDNASHPYGSRGTETLVARVHRVLARLVERFAPDLLVVACNTASTAVLPRLRAHLPLPVVGVVPAIKPAAARTRTGHIALLATPATVERAYTAGLIRDFASHCQVLTLGNSELVALAEAKLRGRPVPESRIAEILAPLLAEPGFPAVDTVVLGCTHFPLLQPELARAMPRELLWVDSGQAVARRTAWLAARLPAPPRRSGRQRLAVFTRDGGDVRLLRGGLARRGFHQSTVLHVPDPPAAANPVPASGS